MKFDEAYVREIVAAANKRKGMTIDEFIASTVRDVNAGYIEEVKEAGKRLVSRRAAARRN
jgi:hypothetical protein